MERNETRNNLVTIENAHIVFVNMQGAKQTYNDEGRRNFNVLLSEDQAEAMRDLGINVRARASKYEDGETQNLLKVNVNVNSKYPPKVYMMTPGGQLNLLSVDMYPLIDQAAEEHRIENVDLTFRAYKSPLRTDDRGLSAYLNSMVVTIEEDPLLKKYRGEEAPF
jgi:NACalpha-BTF3-like transcription factor